MEVFDSSGNFNLQNGDYELTVSEEESKPALSKWEQISNSTIKKFNNTRFSDYTDNGYDNQDMYFENGFESENIEEYVLKMFESYEKKPKLVVFLQWSNQQAENNLVLYKPKLLPHLEFNAGVIIENGNLNSAGDKNLNNNESMDVDEEDDKQVCTKKEAEEDQENVNFVFNFTYANSRQMTEVRNHFMCTLCSLNCMRMYSLLKHLKLCHNRFLFTYVPSQNGSLARIDVTINEKFDGSYVGSAHDLLNSYVIKRTKVPKKRDVCTQVLVFPKTVGQLRRQPHHLSEFMEADADDMDGARPHITGHNRVYYHTENCLPIKPNEMEYDSEGEPDPYWLQRKTMQRIDDFADVNEGEKEMMKLWNLHVMKYK